MADSVEKAIRDRIQGLKGIKASIKDLDEQIKNAPDSPGSTMSLKMKRNMLQSELDRGTSGMNRAQEARVKEALANDDAGEMDVDEGGRRRRKTRKTRKQKKHTKKSRKHRK
jgi:hypothetical protein